MSTYLTPSARLDAHLQTAVCARPGQLGAPPSAFAATVELRVWRRMRIGVRAAQIWRWRRQLGAAVMKRRSN
jgi:hypothetical protein